MIMKTNKLIVTLSAVAVAAFVAGCGDSKPKTDEKPAETSSSTTTPKATLPEAANQAVDSAKATATAVVQETKTVVTNAVAQIEQTTTTVKVEAQKAVDSAQATVTNATASATAQAQSLIDKAKALVTDKKYQEALTSLQQLTGFQLTADQQKMVDDLKASITSALNSEAGKAVQGLFK